MPNFFAGLGIPPEKFDGQSPSHLKVLFAAHVASLLLYPAVEQITERERFVSSVLNRFVRCIVGTQTPLPDEIANLTGEARMELEAEIGIPIEMIPVAAQAHITNTNLAWLASLFGGPANLLALLGDASSEDEYKQLLEKANAKVESVGWAVYLFLILSMYHSNELKRGASLEKGKSLASEWLSISFRTINNHWDEMRPVSHFCAAIVALRASGVHVDLVDPEKTATVVALARTFEKFLLEHSTAPVGMPDLWLIPQALFRYLPHGELPGGGFSFSPPPLAADAIAFVNGETAINRRNAKSKRSERARGKPQ